MKRNQQKRGSALLMAVGLITILAMLGATFLVIAHLDARQSSAIASRSPVPSVVDGIVLQLAQTLTADTYVSTNGPYDETTTAQARWVHYIDYPSNSVDKWLASDFYSAADTWAHLSNLYDDPNYNAKFNSVYIGDPNNLDPNYVDIDGLGTENAYPVDLNSVNSNGDRYYAAIRVLDTSGMLNVNIAGDPNAASLPSISCPIDVDLQTFLGTTLYDSLHTSRCGSVVAAMKTLNNYWENVGKRVFTPAAGYAPFDIGEELYFRCLNQTNSAGRLPTIITSDPNKMRRYLTTVSSSRDRVRNPASGYYASLQINSGTFADPNDRQALYNRVDRLLSTWISNDAIRHEAAASFVANLWAYQSDPNTYDSNTFGFQPSGQDPNDTWTAYAIRKPEVFITEAWGKGETVAVDNVKKASAIELYNVSDHSVNLSDYKLKIGSDPNTGLISLSGTLGTGNTPDRKHVLCSETPSGDPNSDSFFVLHSAVTSDHRTVIASLDFSATGKDTIYLYKTIDGVNIPIDQVTLTYTLPPSDTVGAKTEIDRRRCDNFITTLYTSGDPNNRTSNSSLFDWRYMVPGTYQQFDDSGHKLGISNSVLPGSVSIGDYPCYVTIANQSLSQIGQLGDIVFAGPFIRNGSPVPFLSQLTDSQFLAAFPDEPVRARLNVHPSAIGASGTSGWSSGVYPDVPAACLLNELMTVVPTDPNRSGDYVVYGRINPNTASYEALKYLPFPNTINYRKAGDPNVYSVGVSSDRAAAYIMAYRDRLSPAQTEALTDEPNLPDYTTRSAVTGAYISNLRNYTDPNDAAITSNINGYLTPGEIAVPLADYANEQMGWTNYSSEATTLTKAPGYAAARDSLYRAISDNIAVHSDTFAAVILIQLRDPSGTAVKHTWRFLAVIDRSNCNATGEEPTIRLLTEF